ncbi:hypothetical protein HDU81_005379 [Chytriomyces hyalinus]|nr:hypothetical protein HDU81_005379 [Chytriomyces hyalinus]
MSDSDGESLTEDEEIDETEVAKSILSLSGHSAVLRDDQCVICRLVTREGSMIRSKLGVHLKAYVTLKRLDYESMEDPAQLYRVKCYKPFENWKKTQAGKMAVQLFEATLAKGQDRELHPEEKDDRETSRKKHKGNSAVSMKGKENVEDVLIQVALHSSTDRKGHFEVIKYTQVRLPESIASLSDLRQHLEVELESWDPYEWTDAIMFQVGTKKSDQTVMEILNFTACTSIVQSIVHQKQTPVLVLKQQKPSRKEADSH